MGNFSHELTAGVRYHRDEEDRFQHQDVFSQDSAGIITSVAFGSPGSQDNREKEVGAVALFLHDRIEFGNWWFTPGIRYEHLYLENRDFRPGKTSGDKTLNMVGGGIGAGDVYERIAKDGGCWPALRVFPAKPWWRRQ